MDFFMPPQSHATFRVALVRTYDPKIVSDLFLKTICPILTKLYTHVCDHDILIKFDSHGNRFSHLGVTALYLKKKKRLEKYLVWVKLLHC